LGSHGARATSKYSFEMTVMIVTFINAFGIDFGNFLNARLMKINENGDRHLLFLKALFNYNY
jgi:hypothetical protein